MSSLLLKCIEFNLFLYHSGMYDSGALASDAGRHVKSNRNSEDRKSPSTVSNSQNHTDSTPAHFAEISAADAAISSTENLLRNIQGLLKVAADNAKQQERRINVEKGELLSPLFFKYSLLSVSMKYGVTFFNGCLAEFVYH